jgi:P-type Mg2+ transporter
MRFLSTSSGGACPSCWQKAGGKHLLICKGAVEEVFAACSSYDVEDESGALDPSHVQAAKEEMTLLNQDGFRLIAIAYKEIAASRPAYSISDEQDLALLGYIAFLDPRRPATTASPSSRRTAGSSS